MEKGPIEHILTHTKIKIKVDAVLDETGKGEALRWMKEVKKLREVHKWGESVNVRS